MSIGVAGLAILECVLSADAFGGDVEIEWNEIVYSIFSIIGPVLLGVGLFLAALHWVNSDSARRFMAEKTARDPLSETLITIDAATIADDMMPLFAPNLIPGDQIFIAGSDAAYAESKKGPTLINGIKTWGELGAKTNYVVFRSKKHKSEKNQLEALGDEKSTSVTIHHVSPSGNSKDLSEKFATMHPSLIVRGGKPVAMWVEGYHAKASIFAYNVRFASPTVIRNDELIASEAAEYYQDFCRLIAASDNGNG